MTFKKIPQNSKALTDLCITQDKQSPQAGQNVPRYFQTLPCKLWLIQVSLDRCINAHTPNAILTSEDDSKIGQFQSLNANLQSIQTVFLVHSYQIN